MPDPQGTNPPPTQQATGVATPLVIPDDVKAQHAELVDFIIHSESMNDEERQYWVNILPIMTPEQIGNLRDILTTERQQLSAIDAQYAKAIDRIGQEEFLKQVGDARQKRRSERTEAESAAKEHEEQAAGEVLKHIEGQS